MKQRITAIFAVVILLMAFFALPVMAENTDTTTDNSTTTETTTTEPEIKGGLMAITFDDGPSQNTEKLLDELKKRDIKVTFFVVGERLDEFSDLLIREYKEGHEIGSHTWNHMNLANNDSTTANQNLQKTEDKVNEILGTDIGTLIIRPPYGSVNDNVRSYVDAPLILWSIDTLDWKSRNADAVKEKIINQASDGAIILLHDLYETSVDGAIAAIDELQKEGYTFVTVSELFRRKGQALEAGVSYTNAESNGVDLGPLPEVDPEEEAKEEKKAEKEKQETERVDKGFPTGWLIFCIMILLIYGMGMLHMFNIIHIAPLNNIIQTGKKDFSKRNTATHSDRNSANRRNHRNASRHRGSNADHRQK